ncbi:MAG: IS3 family transposase [Actinomycetota bacterium]|nr:IS3 family transposase [Actinomycetota bacterium]
MAPGQYTSLAFGRALRAAGLVGPMGTVGDCFDNAVAESFFATLQTELLDRQYWSTRHQLELAVFDFIEAFYNRTRRQSRLGYRSPFEYEKMHRVAPLPNNPMSTRPGQLHRGQCVATYRAFTRSVGHAVKPVFV